ncbi:MAG: peptide ABC transporter substrate-binding protein [Treponema sp.]|nr:peptide ABC transporter substrate-binding protein [Treponema sp.]
MIKKFSLLLIISLLSLNVFAQNHEEPDIEELEREANQDEESQVQIDQSLQDSFYVIDAVRKRNLDPQLTTYAADAQILSGLYEGLFSYNPVTLEPQYAIAQDYKISRDKKRITFVLRDNAYFSNGEKITAESVKESWLQLLANPMAPYSSLLDIVRGAREYRNGQGNKEDVGIFVLDDRRLSVYLNSPANYLPKVLCHSAFSIVHKDKNVFSGPYVISYSDSSSLVLTKNEYYWDLENTNINSFYFIQSNDADQNTLAYNAGTVSWVDSDIQMDKLLNTNSIQMNAEFGTTYYFFKLTARKPQEKRKEFNPWDYPEFRKAVIEVMPWDSLRQSSFVSASSFVYPLTGYPQVEGFDYTDEIEAKIIMEEAKEKYGLDKDLRIPLVLEISEGASNPLIEEALKTSLDIIGVDLIIRKLPVYDYLANVRNTDADLLSYSWIGDFADPLAFLTLFQGDSTLNDSGWANSEYDQLLKEAASTSSEQDRYELLAKAEILLLDSGMVMPISHPVAFNIIDLDEVGGWANNAFNIHPLKYIFKKLTPSTAPNIVMNIQ